MVTRTSPFVAAEAERDSTRMFFGVVLALGKATAPEAVRRFHVGTGVYRDYLFEGVAEDPRSLVREILGVSDEDSFVKPYLDERLVKSHDQLANLAILARALEAPHVEVPVHDVPALSGNLVRDVRVLTNLTNNDLAEAFGVKERTILNVQSGRVSGDVYETRLNALLAIAGILVRAVGPEGVKKWLTLGSPSRMDRIANGEIEQVHDEARAYMR